MLYSDVQNRLQLRKSTLELTVVNVEPPAETIAQKAEKLLAERNKAEWTLNNRVKLTQQAVNNLQVMEILAESQHLAEELAEIDELWWKTVYLTTQVARYSEADAAETVKAAQ